MKTEELGEILLIHEDLRELEARILRPPRHCSQLLTNRENPSRIGPRMLSRGIFKGIKTEIYHPVSLLSKRCLMTTSKRLALKLVYTSRTTLPPAELPLASTTTSLKISVVRTSFAGRCYLRRLLEIRARAHFDSLALLFNMFRGRSTVVAIRYV